MADGIEIRDLGKMDYGSAWQAQKELVAARQRGDVPDTIIVVEHEPVFTLGRAGSRSHIHASTEELAAENIKVYPVERGGDVTYHGPGQLVVYPILDLRQHRKDLHWVLRTYEEAAIIALRREFSLEGKRDPEYPGVWIDGAKVAAIGVAVSRWVTYHGLALNVNPDMRHYGMIIPCGLTDRPVTSLSILLQRPVSVEEVKNPLLEAFTEVLGFT